MIPTTHQGGVAANMESRNGFCFTQDPRIFTQGCNDCRFQLGAHMLSMEPNVGLLTEEEQNRILEECGVTTTFDVTAINMDPTATPASSTTTE